MRVGVAVLVLLNFLSIVCSCSATLLNINDQSALLEDAISERSWRRRPINHPNDRDHNQPISQYLINTINLQNDFSILDLNTRKTDRFNRITEQLPCYFRTVGDPTRNFWGKNRHNHVTMKNAFRESNPREQQRILSYRELAKFTLAFNAQYDLDQTSHLAQHQHPTGRMIDHQNFQEDDVIRALSLSGTFCVLDKESGDLEPIFSGMLDLAQSYDRSLYFVHSCLHGFKDERIDDIYFIPYGLPIQEINAFQVQSVFGGVNNDGFRDHFRQADIKAMSDHYAYRNQDYAMVIIRGYSAENNLPLWAVLSGRQDRNLFSTSNLFPGFENFDGNLPCFIGSNQLFDNYFNNFQLNGNSLEKIYVIGRPGDARFKLNSSGFAVATNLTNTISQVPRVSLRDDPDLYVPPEIELAPNRVALTYPSVPGMSGGIVLKSFVMVRLNGTIAKESVDLMGRSGVRNAPLQGINLLGSMLLQIL